MSVRALASFSASYGPLRVDREDRGLVYDEETDG